MTTKRLSVVALAVLALALGASDAAAIGVDEVVARVRQALTPGRDQRASFDLVIANAKGESVTWSGTYLRRNGPEAQVRFEFSAPPDVKGMTVSVHEHADRSSHTRIFVPAIRRARNLEGDMRGESFLGTDFNYEDLGLQPFEFQEHALAGEETKDGKTYYRLESVPQQGWWYGKIVEFIDKETFLPVRTEYYDRGGELWKLRTLDVIETVGEYVTPLEITMRTVPAGTATHLRLREVAYDIGLTDKAFAEP